MRSEGLPRLLGVGDRSKLFGRQSFGVSTAKRLVRKALFLLSLGLACLFLPPNTVGAAEIRDSDVVAPKYANEPIQPIPVSHNENEDIAALGRKLFQDPRLSRDDTIACTNCHPLDNAGVDGLQFSIGIDGNVGNINAPSVFNVSLHEVFFWDGRATNLEEQMTDPVQDENEMGSNWNEVVEKLKIDSGYAREFAKLYPGGITPENVSHAIATFERTLLTPNSRFDLFLKGDESAISDDEKQGYILFKAYGCASCHQGRAVGANVYEKMGIYGDYFADRGGLQPVDYGRFNVTQNEEDKFYFKVPSLRNIALTAPYFHDGTAETLTDAIRVMAKYQLGRPIKDKDIELIVAFLKTLNGEFEK